MSYSYYVIRSTNDEICALTKSVNAMIHTFFNTAFSNIYIYIIFIMEPQYVFFPISGAYET